MIPVYLTININPRSFSGTYLRAIHVKRRLLRELCSCFLTHFEKSNESNILLGFPWIMDGTGETQIRESSTIIRHQRFWNTMAHLEIRGDSVRESTFRYVCCIHISVIYNICIPHKSNPIEFSFFFFLSTGRDLKPNWLYFKGKWGNPKSKCHPFKRIGLNFCEFSDGPTGIPLKEHHFNCDAI